MMNQGLITAWFFVTVFWAVFLSLFAGTQLWALPLFLGWAFAVVAIAVLLGFGGWYLFRGLYRAGEVSDVMGGFDNGEVTINLGGVPYHDGPVRGKADPLQVFAGAINLESYRKAYPAHAALLEAMLRVMASKPNLPASHVPGGHGGATLIQHSVNVLKAMRSACVDWKFEGHKNKDGTFWYTVMPKNGVSYHAFSPTDPILPLAAFGHDIGKTFCYVEDGQGGVSEKTVCAFDFVGSILNSDKNMKKKVPHDTEGARLLRRMPELWELPREDVSALLVAVGYYHKVGQIPTSDWITDRAHSLTELLLYADVQAGMMEDGGLHPVSGAENVPRVAVAPAAPVSPVSGVAAVAEPVAVATQLEATRENVLPDVAEGNESAQPAALSSEALDDYQYELFMEVLADENMINGKDARQRIGFKFGDWLYISDMKLRDAMMKKTKDPSYVLTLNDSGEQARGQMHDWTKRLLKRLEEQGLLMVEFGGARFSHKRALFNTVSTTEGHAGKEERFVMVVSSGILKRLRSLPDCKTPPRITGCSWGDKAAINKKAELGKTGGGKTTAQDKRAPLPADGSAVSGHDCEIFHDQEEVVASGQSSVIASSDNICRTEVIDSLPDVFEDETLGMLEEQWSLVETLHRVVRGEEQDGAPPYFEMQIDGVRYALFDQEEVVMAYGISEEDLVGVTKLKGGESKRLLIGLAL